MIYLPDRRQHGRKKVTSGSNKRQRTTAVRVRLHPADLDRLKLEAAEAGMSVAGYLASGRLGTEAAARPRMTRRRMRADVSAFLEGVVEIKRGNSLLNQQTHATNLMMLFAEEHSAARLADEVRAWRLSLDRLWEQNAVTHAAILAALDSEREG
ncbi:MAG: hypothetical protein JOZ58_19980 [Acetobacteraceae bacterium]|nr:hypothetical protein [Acetobacteraceae bacterium]